MFSRPENISSIAFIREARAGRASSWNTSGANGDCWVVPAGEAAILADIEGPGCITHIWMTQIEHYRECLIKITFDNAEHPSVFCPLGDFFCLGHGMVNTFESMYFTASRSTDDRFADGCALNCYLPMPFKERAVVEIINQSGEQHMQFFYIDYEQYGKSLPQNAGYLHAEFRRVNLTGGWGPGLTLVETGKAVNKEEQAYNHNYVILETEGRGHYIGCNLSVANFFYPPDGDNWWGEGDDMIWVDGYKWPPDLHGTGTEDYFSQAWGTQPNCFLRNGSSIRTEPRRGFHGDFHTYYVFHVENPVHFKESIKVTIEHGHANSLSNDYSSVAYWYSDRPTKIAEPPSVEQRMPIAVDEDGGLVRVSADKLPGRQVRMTPQMERIVEKAKETREGKSENV